jgi:hypothetical protein
MQVLCLVQKMHLSSLNDEGMIFCNTLVNQSLLNKGGLLVMLQNVDIYRYYEKFGKNGAFP